VKSRKCHNEGNFEDVRLLSVEKKTKEGGRESGVFWAKKGNDTGKDKKISTKFAERRQDREKMELGKVKNTSEP